MLCQEENRSPYLANNGEGLAVHTFIQIDYHSPSWHFIPFFEKQVMG